MTLLEIVYGIVSGLILTIIGVVIAELLLARYFNKPKIKVGTLRDFDKLGFSVSIERGLVKDARVLCNNVPCSWWEDKDNTIRTVERKDLFAGDKPSSFFPFQVNIEYKKDLYKFLRETHPGIPFPGIEEPLDGMFVTIKQLETDIVSDFSYPFPKDFTIHQFQDFKKIFLYPQFIKKPLLDKISIRIIGEGIDEITDFSSYYIELSNMNLAAVRAGDYPETIIPLIFHLKKKRSPLHRMLRPDTEEI